MRNVAFLGVVLVGCCCAGSEPGSVVHAQTETVSWGSGERWVVPELTPDELEAELHGALVVPPDRALVTIEARLRSPDRATATRRVRELADALAARAAEGCALRVFSLAPALHESDGFETAATLSLDVDLRGEQSASSRHERLESCVQIVHDLPRDDFGELEVRVSAPLVTIDDPAAHREALLARRLAALHAVAAHGGPPQLRTDALRCTSTGQVILAHRSLHGVRLDVDLACDRDADDPDAVAIADVR